MFTLNACPKPQHKRKAPKRADIGKFDKVTRLTIIQRDNGFCVRCGRLYEEIHHIIYRSALGKGTVDNGACVCGSCDGLRQDQNRRRKLDGKISSSSGYRT